jgi:hypothetical protein
MRREEVQRHVAPVVAAFFGIELMHGHQLDDGDAELLQIRNLFDDPGKGAAGRRGHTRVREDGEPAHVHLVHDRVVRVPREHVAVPVELGVVRGQFAEGTATGVRSGPDRAVPRIAGREEHAARIRVEQDLLRIEAIASCGSERAIDAVAVVRGRAGAGPGDARVPDAAGLVTDEIERDLPGRHRQIRGVEQQQGHRGRMTRVDGEIERLLCRYPLRAERQRRAVDFVPARHQS